MRNTHIFRLFGSRPTALYFLSVWIVAIVSSIWWLTPSDDDGYYVHQIFSFIEFGTIGLFYIETFLKTFVGFPGYPAVQGSFFVLWDAVGLPINLYTYKAFQILVMVLLVGLSARLVFVLTEDQYQGSDDPDWVRTTAWARTSFMLVVLGISPFLIDTLFMRPEPAGLLSIVLALLAFRRCNQDGARTALWAAITGFFIGAAAIMHPTFMVAGGLVGLSLIGFFLKRRQYLHAVLGSGLALVPIAAAVSWFLANGSFAVNTIVSHYTDRAPHFGGAVQNVTSMIAEPFANPTMASLFFSVPLSVLAIIVLLVVGLLIWRIAQPALPHGWRHGATPIGPVTAVDVFFLGALLNFLLDSGGRVQILTVLGFAASLALATALRSNPGPPNNPRSVQT